MFSLFEHLLSIFHSLHVFLHTQIANKQRSSFVSSTVVTKLQFIRTEAELVYIGSRRTTSFNENNR